MTLEVTEMFKSLAGETSRAGRPCAFVRLSGCNLDCAWCDTKYARKKGRDIELEEIYNRIIDMETDLACVTGGEPLLQDDTIKLVNKFLRSGREVLIETNGSLSIAGTPKRARRIVDVKTPGSGECGSFLEENIDHLGRNDEVKFVVGDRFDFDWSVDFVRRFGLVGKCDLLVSPAWIKGSSRSGNTQFKRELAEWVLTSGIPFRYNIQFHKVIWGSNRRGV